MKSDYYYIVQVIGEDDSIRSEIENFAFNHGTTGIEEFSIDEVSVDKILGERSYSGADLPESVINEVENTVRNNKLFLKCYFENNETGVYFLELIKSTYNVDVTISKEKNQDWNAEWRKHYSLIEIADDFFLIPSWEKELHLLDSNKKNLFIYPGMGFGTGNHETTYLCLKLFHKHISKLNKTLHCLDFGAGSGILGLAVKLFKLNKSIDLYDIDSEALKNCEQNILLNDFPLNEFQLLLPKDRDSFLPKYDLVFANILQNVLLHEKSFLANSLLPNGLLILSGLLEGQDSLVISSYVKENPNLSLLDVVKKGDWIALILRNNK